MIIALYIAFFFLILRFSVTVFNFLSNPKLRRVSRNYQDKVSVLIPARNESDNILSLLNSIIRQDYTNYEVIILDDNSEDNTYEICAAFAADHRQFKVIKGKSLAGGWLGKNYACHQLAQHATGNYYLFLDADETVKNGLINSAVHRMYLNKLCLLSLFTNQQMHSFGEKLTVPLMHYILLNLLPLRLVFLSKNAAFAAASGQFMMFEANCYREYQWHQLARAKVVEDVEIMKLVKAARLNGEALLANGMISCRMYKSYSEAVAGFGKNFLAAFNYNITGFLIYLTLLVGGPMVIIMTLNLNFILMMTGLIALTRIMISFAAGQSVIQNILLHPLQMVSLLIIGFTSIQKKLTKTTVWKGRKVQS
ncbi:glycosyltransferase [Mucilaginibacter segetis]|uniref:Glycosyltransferase family 2 protein n=1 Tax=Mucilaginibacter segetis TaxID=2793071 RepID=A0A934PRH5_9SPHI|nr:glycosyltransferase family 2 protein [Mucilaginibacter segetis]MBK0377906.1 glycosyltransferase family 2 protein [Mucilaginibacter segetis]